ncbi:MAG: DNA primase [Candidatus Nealsonbacteria bacterium]|nr:DNA primase [Candidatus Nealsonbacteria bacterium]
MSNSPIEEIKSRLDIVDVIGSYIKLKKAGANYRAQCPFHSEKTPSFFVSPARQIWHCFGCGEGHSVFDFVMKIEGVEFGDALRILANRAGVDLKPTSPQLKTKRNRLYNVCDLAAKFFQAQLEKSSNGKEAKKYLLGRGISEESINQWRLGWAPNAWQGLSDFLATQGYGKEEARRAGLVSKNQKGNYYDRFRARIMFPVFDFNSQIIGFGGRVLKKNKDKAKYINSPSTLLYDKGKVLYGLDRARVDIRKEDLCMLAEGYVDVILSHQIGMKNMVATSGTALTASHLRILKRYSNNLLFAFDMDFAGGKATKRGIEMAQSQGFDLKILRLSKGKDPADAISENPEDFKKAVKNSVSIFDFYFQDVFERFDKDTPQGKKKIASFLLPKISRIPNRIEQSHWIQQLANRLNVKEKYIEEELKKVKSPGSDKEVSLRESKHPAVQKTREQLLEERLMSLLLKHPQHCELLDQETLSTLSPRAKQVADNFQEKEKWSPHIKEFVNYLVLKADVERIEEEDVASEVELCIEEIKALSVRSRLNEISLEIKRAEEENNTQKIKKLTEQFAQWSKKIAKS